MELKVFSIYDIDAQAYNNPFFMLTQAEARRAIVSLSMDGDHMFSKFPHKFELFMVGRFDNLTGKFDQTEFNSLGTVASNKVDQHNVETLYPSKEESA